MLKIALNGSACIILVFSLLLAVFPIWPKSADAARIKDIAAIKGIRKNQLTGYGLVIGLDGTGDSANASFTNQALANMMERMNIDVNQNQLQVDNVAAVMVTADIPPFARIGDNIDIMVSSLGDAESIAGGTLLITPLKGVDGRVYAIGQGSVTVGGGEDGHQQVARISNGATVEREIPFRLDGKKKLVLSLYKPDFTTARRVADTINASLGEDVAETIDSSALQLNVPEKMRKKGVSEFIADIETLSVVPDSTAKVVINERTGTVVIGEQVTISPVAVAHGTLSVVINQGQADEQENRVMELQGNATIGELVNGLNSIGASPDDLVTILQSIKAAGALQAELEII
ncbi:MAG: flagellar basal body P-ring protein FlgI [Desulfobacteraceae bacterium]